LQIPAQDKPGNTKGGSITVPLTSCFTSLDLSVLQIKTKIVSCHAADSKPVKQEVNGTVILPPLAFPGQTNNQNKNVFTIKKVSPFIKKFCTKKCKLEFSVTTQN
jgi:hypothetical protein